MSQSRLFNYMLSKKREREIRMILLSFLFLAEYEFCLSNLSLSVPRTGIDYLSPSFNIFSILCSQILLSKIDNVDAGVNWNYLPR